MISQKSVLIGTLVSLILLALFSLGLGLLGFYVAVFIGALITTYLASGKEQLKVIESGLHGIIVGIFTGVIYILFLYAYSGFSKIVAGILIYAALVLIGGFIIVGALGGIIGLLISVKTGHMGIYEREIEESKEEIESSEKND
ncbi:MAG: DUF5518 domain-containing protein [Methanobacterium sp. ERen5]|nr:MAG: DUF5518 domain-containing protein [Methanobacterium sp. ERen5]